MRIRAPFFTLELKASTKLDEDDWCTVVVEVEANKFTGRFSAWLQGEDLDRFRRELDALIDGSSSTHAVTLYSKATEIEVSLRQTPRGPLKGNYALQPAPERTVLLGTFEVYPSFLPPVRQSVAELIASLRPENAAQRLQCLRRRAGPGVLGA